MSEERRRILQMLADGKIKVEEAERLLKSVGEEPPVKTMEADSGPKVKTPKFLRVVIAPKDNGGEHADGHGHHRHKHDKVNIRIPLVLIKAGVKLGSVMPSEARDKINNALKAKGLDIDLNKLDADSIDRILQAMSEMSIDVDDEDETVRVYCE